MCKEDIVLVSGMPRSGTSLLLQMLHAGGLRVVSDKASRPPDVHNPRGYLEHPAVKSLVRGPQPELWRQARGGALKVIHRLLPHVPPNNRYRVLLLERPRLEIAASQMAMLALEPSAADQQCWAARLEREWQAFQRWLATQTHLPTLNLTYGGLLNEKKESAIEIARFLNKDLAVEAMLDCVDNKLYRQRANTL